MSTIAFVTYEIHPTTWGGAGVLLRHAAERLLAAGHEVLFLFDAPKQYFDRFDREHRLQLPNPEACRAYHVDALVEGRLPVSEEELGNAFLWKSLRFDVALGRVLEREAIDFVEFFEYCGVGHHALVAKAFGRRHSGTILGMRAHNSVELIDAHESTKPLDRERYLMYRLERSGLARAETVLFPSQSYAEAYYLDRYGIDRAAVVVSEPPTRPLGAREASVEPGCEVLYFGRVFEFKGVETFVRAALLHLDERPESALRFVLVGPDTRDSVTGASYSEHLRAGIPSQLQERFEFAGHLSHDQLLARLPGVLFGVFPNRFESFCYAAHELYEAGVPLVLNDIPAFRNYFEAEKNCLLFDGSIAALSAAIGRLEADAELRERIARPYPVATRPLGEFYERPHAGCPIGAGAEGAPQVLAIVLCEGEGDEEAERATVAALRAGRREPGEIVLARRIGASEPASGASRWLGRLGSFADVRGAPLREVRTLDALWVLAAGDEPSTECLALCGTALAIDPALRFAGCWARDAAGSLVGTTLDIAPELHPFEHGSRPTRALIRTQPGALVDDLFDPACGSYGEIAHLWRLIDEGGRGAVLSELHLELSPSEPIEHREEHLAYLVAQAGPRLRTALATHGVVLQGRLNRRLQPEAAARPAPTRERAPTPKEVRELAGEHLNGTTLLKMALAKLRTKLARSLRSSAERTGR